ncbi:hypothetical protein [Caldisalinibacter kiritimatiensis]|uniref:Iron-sulfur-binding protein n=1 Tax=Caldisalinibacter kiritimatiensis TaxID=1304284 RepID=R1CSF3_9FIRM|nr:hypothetical protein [Caldisalinibacter kiritimatiensis]EOD01586.1 Iron-sulfur-binding protein [Caldisalinibacter kiritimatiensis]
MKHKSHMNWSWIIMITFILLSILDIRFGILGFLCMGAPLYHALRGRGKVHCIKYCPRGSLLGKFLSEISLNNNLPKGMNTKKFKNILLTLMIVLFSFSLYHAGFDFERIAFSVFRFMTVSLVVGIIVGVIFRPRSWCVICPMGHATGIIRNKMNGDKKAKSKPNTKAA